MNNIDSHIKDILKVSYDNNIGMIDLNIIEDWKEKINLQDVGAGNGIYAKY